MKVRRVQIIIVSRNVQVSICLSVTLQKYQLGKSTMAFRILLKATGSSDSISREVNVAHILKSHTGCGSFFNHVFLS